MKHLKILGLAVVAAMALTAFVGVGTAAAGPTELYVGHTTAGNTDNTGGVEIHATIAAGTSALLSDTSGELADTCKASTVLGKTTNTTATTLDGNISSLTWGECDFPTKTLTGKEGSLDITYVGDKNADGQGDGTVTGTGSEVTVLVFGFIDCIYGTGAGTHLGTLSGSTAGHASLAINATIELQSGGFGCPETTKWVANYTVTTPTGLNVRE